MELIHLNVEKLFKKIKTKDNEPDTPEPFFNFFNFYNFLKDLIQLNICEI